MRKLKIAGLLLTVVCMSGFVAQVVHAEEFLLAEWLINGGEELELVSVSAAGELTLIDLKAIGGGTASVVCTETWDGSTGPNGEFEVTEILNSTGEKIGTELTGVALKCAGHTGCEGTDAEVWIDNLPWHFLLFLLVAADAPAGSIGVKIGGIHPPSGEAGFEVKCLVLGVAFNDLCEGGHSAFVENMAGEGDALADFTEAFGLGTCTVGGVGTGAVDGELLLSTLGGTALSASSE